MGIDANRNNGGEIPKASEGQEISSSDINNLANAVQRAGLAQSLSGVRSANFGDGNTFSISNKNAYSHPWKAFRDGLQIRINLGCVFVDIPNAGGYKISTDPARIASGKNAWIPKSQAGVIPNGYPTLSEPISYFPMGAELWVDIPNANILSTRQLVDPRDKYIRFLAVDSTNKFKAGVYYIQMTAWSGRQLTGNPYPNTDIPALAQANADVQLWNNYSSAMKGKILPVLKFASYDEVPNPNPDNIINCYDIKDMYYPLFSLDYRGFVYQSIKSDIYMNGYTLKPFEVSVIGNNFYVAAGTVNGVVPTINLDPIDSIPKPYITRSGGSGRIYLKAQKQTGTFFPTSVSIVFENGDTPPADTVTFGYLQIASVQKVNNNFVVTQISTGNKLLNRTQMGSSNAWWAWSS